jgi:hypothetical protein
MNYVEQYNDMNNNILSQTLVKRHIINVKLGRLREYSVENTGKSLIYMDGKPLEITANTFEFIANDNHSLIEDVNDNIIMDLQESLERIKGTKGITSISIRVYE